MSIQEQDNAIAKSGPLDFDHLPPELESSDSEFWLTPEGLRLFEEERERRRQHNRPRENKSLDALCDRFAALFHSEQEYKDFFDAIEESRRQADEIGRTKQGKHHE